MEQTINSRPMLPGVGDWLARGWTIYRQKISSFIVLMLVPAILMLFVRVFDLSDGFLAFIVNILGALLIIWANIGLVEILLLEDKMRSDLVYKKTWPKLWSYVWIAILSLFIIGGSYFLLIVPGVVFTVWFLFTLFIYVIEGKKGLSAFEMSRAYVHGYFWPILWRYLLIIVLSILVSLIISSVAGLFGALAISLASVIVGVFLMPLIATYTFVLYSDLKKIKGEAVSEAMVDQKWLYILTGLAGWIFVFIITILMGVAFFSFLSGAVMNRGLGDVQISIIK